MSYERDTCSESSTVFCRCLTWFLGKIRKNSQKIAKNRFKSYDSTANFSVFEIRIFRINSAARSVEDEKRNEGTGTRPDYLVNRVLTVNSGLKWAQSWNQYKRSKNIFDVISIALSLPSLCTKLLELPAQSPIGSPGTLLGMIVHMQIEILNVVEILVN